MAALEFAQKLRRLLVSRLQVRQLKRRQSFKKILPRLAHTAVRHPRFLKSTAGGARGRQHVRNTHAGRRGGRFHQDRADGGHAIS